MVIANAVSPAVKNLKAEIARLRAENSGMVAVKAAIGEKNRKLAGRADDLSPQEQEEMMLRVKLLNLAADNENIKKLRRGKSYWL